jgi:hypothetical protein
MIIINIAMSVASRERRNARDPIQKVEARVDWL